MKRSYLGIGLGVAASLMAFVTAVPAAGQTGPMDPSQPALPPVEGPPGYAPPLGPGPGSYPPPAQGGGERFVDRFRAANITNDGRLTLAQAQAAGLMPVVRHFAELDPTNRGYTTLQDIRAYVQRMRAMRAQTGPVQ